MVSLVSMDCSLSYNNFGDEGAVIVAEALEVNNTLTKLEYVLCVVPLSLII